MPKPQPKSELDQYIDAAAELRQLLRQSHEAIRDLRAERRAFREERDAWLSGAELRAQLDKTTAEMIESFTSGVLESVEDATTKVYHRFDQIMMICLGEDPISVRDGKKTVIELVLEFIAARGLPIRATEQVHLLMSAETKAKQEVILASIGINSFPSGRSFSDLPIVLDPRVPDGIGYVVIPRPSDGGKRKVFEINVQTGEGADLVAEELLQIHLKQEEEVPAAFRKKDERVEPA